MSLEEEHASYEDNYQAQLLAWEKESKRPLTKEDFGVEKVTQIQIDAINVKEGRVEITTFDQTYQQKIHNYYRFAPVNVGSANSGGAGQRSGK